MIDTRSVCNNQRRSRIRLCLGDGLNGLIIISAHCNLCNIYVAIAHCDGSEIFLFHFLAGCSKLCGCSDRRRLGRLTAGVGIYLGIKYHDINILTAGEDVVNAGSLKTPSAELILAAGVDFALLTPTLSGHIALGETLRAAGVRTAFFDVETFEDYLRCLDFCARLTGQPQRYEQYGTAVQASVDEAIALGAGQEQAPRVLLLRAYSTGVKAKNSGNNMVGAMLRDLGCENIADGQDTLLENLTLEAIVAADPDFIFITTMGADDEALASLAEHLQSGPAWAGLTAVKEGRCFVLPKDLFHYKPCERWGESYHQLAEMLYGAE